MKMNSISGICSSLVGLLLLFWGNVHAQPIELDWDKTYGGVEGERLGQLVLIGNDRFILLGSSNSDSGFEKSQSRRDAVNPISKYVDYWGLIVDNQGNKFQDFTYGGDNGELGYCILSHSNGSIYLAGESSSDIGFDRTVPQRGGGDIWLLRLDANLNKLWDKAYGGGATNFNNEIGTSVCHAIAEMPNGDIILAGYSNCDAGNEKSENARGPAYQSPPRINPIRDLWVLRLNPEGNRVWDKTLGGSGDDFNSNANSLLVTASGNILVVGRSSSDVSGEKSEANRGGYDFWLVMLDGNGNKLWDKTYGGNGPNDVAEGVLALASGDFLVVGRSDSGADGDKTYASKGQSDGWVLRIDANGNLVWQQSYGTSGYDTVVDVVPTSDGNYILLAASNQGFSGDRSEANRGGFDVWLIKIDPSGNILWDKSFGGSAGESPRSIIEVGPDEFLVGCTSQSNASSEKSENSRGGEDYWLFKTRPATPLALGYWHTARAYPQPGSGIRLEWQFSAQQAGGRYSVFRGGVRVHSREVIDSDNYLWTDTATTSGWNRYYIQYHSPSGIVERSHLLEVYLDKQEQSLVESSFRVYPNPGREVLRIDHPATWAGEVLIFDALGRLVLRQPLAGASGLVELDTRLWPAGRYSLQLRDRGENVGLVTWIKNE